MIGINYMNIKKLHPMNGYAPNSQKVYDAMTTTFSPPDCFFPLQKRSIVHRFIF